VNVVGDIERRTLFPLREEWLVISMKEFLNKLEHCHTLVTFLWTIQTLLPTNGYFETPTLLHSEQDYLKQHSLLT
jgi:hypothetical protein